MAGRVVGSCDGAIDRHVYRFFFLKCSAPTNTVLLLRSCTDDEEVLKIEDRICLLYVQYIHYTYIHDLYLIF